MGSAEEEQGSRERNCGRKGLIKTQVYMKRVIMNPITLCANLTNKNKSRQNPTLDCKEKKKPFIRKWALVTS